LDTLTVHACAKINLTLDVFSKRADGYHSIASVFQAIGLKDSLSLERRDQEGIFFSCDSPNAIPVPSDPTNLVWRAADLLLRTSQSAGKTLAGGISIHLEKRIPSQAGLGGGSSDAAATLVGLNHLLELGWEEKALLDMAAQLGSDVPFFILGGTVVARGRGEQLTPLSDAPQCGLVVVKPEIGVSTAWAYNQLDSLPDRVSHRATKRMEEALAQGDRGRFMAWQSNDFELPVFEHYRELSWLHDELRMAGAESVHLCGSGSAVYGMTSTTAQAERIAHLLQQKYPLTFATNTLTRAESNPLATPQA
jgi:4-diphosphocytidyl-2-C-methyl-D-erythritol kinase